MVELTRGNQLTTGDIAMNILKYAKKKGEFNNEKKYWSVNLDLDPIQKEIEFWNNSEEMQLQVLRKLHPRLYIFVGDKLGWDTSNFVKDCKRSHTHREFTKCIQGYALKA